MSEQPKVQLTDEEITRGMNEYEDQKMAEWQKFGQAARAAGINIGGNAGLPELNPDGSEMEAAQDDKKPAGTADKV